MLWVLSKSSCLWRTCPWLLPFTWLFCTYTSPTSPQSLLLLLLKYAWSHFFPSLFMLSGLSSPMIPLEKTSKKFQFSSNAFLRDLCISLSQSEKNNSARKSSSLWTSMDTKQCKISKIKEFSAENKSWAIWKEESLVWICRRKNKNKMDCREN